MLLRERISMVHAHGAFSAIAHEAIIHARTMGYKVADSTMLCYFRNPSSSCTC